MGADSSKKLWADVIDDTTKQTRKVTKTIMKQSFERASKGEEVDEAMMRQMAIDEAKKFDKHNQEMLEKIYSAYDLNKDGTLDLKECKILMVECLKQHRAYVPTQLDSLFDTMMKSALNISKQLGDTDSSLKQLEDAYKKEMEPVKANTLKSLNELFDNLIKDFDTIGELIFKKMDSNGDGVISKEEFTTNWKKEYQKLVNIEQLIFQFQQVVGV